MITEAFGELDAQTVILRHNSLTDIPASASLRIPTIWVSVKRYFLIENLLFHRARKSYFWMVSFQDKLTP